MADDKRGREAQARGADMRQRERALAEALARGGEAEPPIEAEQLAELEAELETVEFPATGRDVVETVGDVELEYVEGTATVAELVPDAEEEVFERPDEVTGQIERPSVAGAIQRVVAAASEQRTEPLRGSQREAYEKSLRALREITPRDDDQGITAVTDWIVGRIETSGSLPGSRAVRREAAAYCRSEGYEVRDDEWLGV